MVKIKKYKPTTGVISKPNTLSGVQYNPADFSRGADAIAKFGQTASAVGMNLFEQAESNKIRKKELESQQELELIKTLDSQANDFLAIKTKIDRSNKLNEALDLAYNGDGKMTGLNSIKKEFITSPDYTNSEQNFANAALAVKTRILNTIDDDVVKNEFITKFDNKTDSYSIDVMDGAFKIGLGQRTAAYKKEHAELLYNIEYGNELEKKQAHDRLLGLNGEVGIHEEAFEQGIINATPDLANFYSQQEVEYIQAKLLIASDPAAYLELAKGDPDKYPFKNLDLAKRADLDISAEKALQTINNKIQTNTEKAKNKNIKNFNKIKSSLEDGIMPVGGRNKLSMYKAIAESFRC